jgi:D-lactate dehydrogenase (cytochrome)
MSAVVATFPTVAAAVETVVTVRGSGLEPAALEFIDAATAALLTREASVDFGQQPALFMEFHAPHQETLYLGLNTVQEICQELGAIHFRATADPAERQQLWRARHHMFETQVRTHPGQRWVILDIAVPISAYPALVGHTEQTLARHGATGYMVGHAGDGNLHVTLPFNDEAGYQRAAAVNEGVVLKALELGGTATGEHGVGIGKARYMRREHGPALDVMRAVKHLLDPKGIMNPGKIFPAHDEE